MYFARIVLGGESFSQILINLDALAFYGKDPKHLPMNSLWGDVMGLLRFLVQLENTVVKAPLIRKGSHLLGFVPEPTLNVGKKLGPIHF